MKKLLVTSALPYANGPIHLGHLVEYIQTDIWVRYWKLRGRDAVYFCADDTHGTPVMLRARDEGITPEQLIDRMRQEHLRDFGGFQVRFDNYYTTHSEYNRQLACGIYQALRDGGHIVERTIRQTWCDRCAMFLPDRYIRGTCPRCGAQDQYGDSCESCSATYNPTELKNARCAQCGGAPTLRESEHLFVRLSDFADRLRAWLASGAVQEEIVNKLEEWLAPGLQDWDISRDAPYFGFEIPGKPGKYFYVWLDAPIGYMASTMDWCVRNGVSFDTYWRSSDEAEVVHFIGKDIVYFHTLFWPAMLMAAGYRTPSRVCVHGFLTVNGQKMSKSRGTFIMAGTYLAHLDPQYLRYYYAAKMTPRVEDIDLSFEDFVNRTNAELVSKIANIPSRTLAIIHQGCGGRLGTMDAAGRQLVAEINDSRATVAASYEARDFAQALRTVNSLADRINGYLQASKPWELVKSDAPRAASACTAALNAFRTVAMLLSPVLPRFAEKVAAMLNLPALRWDDDAPLEERPVNTYERLVERVDRRKVDAMVQAARQ